jgi:hypothetical protein
MSEQGIKQTEGKTSFSEIDWSFVEKMAKCMNLNKGKYPPKNWQKPMNASLLLDAAQRHLIELQKDNLFDKENGAEHAVAIALNMMMYSYQINNYSGLLKQCNIRNVIQYYNLDKVEESQKAIDACKIEKLEKEIDSIIVLNHDLTHKVNDLTFENNKLKKDIEDKYLEIENLQKLFKNQQALYLKEKENNEALDNKNYFLSRTNKALKEENDLAIVFRGEQTAKVKELTLENNKLKKELEAIKNSSKGECNVKVESSVDTQAIINSINDLYIKLNKPISPLRDSSPFPGFPYPHIKCHIKPPFVVNEPFSKPPFIDAKLDIRF